MYLRRCMTYVVLMRHKTHKTKINSRIAQKCIILYTNDEKGLKKLYVLEQMVYDRCCHIYEVVKHGQASKLLFCLTKTYNRDSCKQYLRSTR